MLPLLLTLLVYATQVVAGLVVARPLRGDDARRAWTAGPGLWGRVLLLGPAAIAAQMLLYGVVGVPFTLPAILAPWWIAALLARRSTTPAGAAPAPSPRGPLFAALVAVLLVAVAFAGRAGTPIHEGDEMHNFALSAKVFAMHAGLAPAALRALVDPGHNEYPPLVALNQALLFLAGEELAPWSARGLSGLAYLALCLLAADVLWCARAPVRSFLLAVLVVAAPGYATYAADGRPDLRLTASVLLLGAEGLELRRGGALGAWRFAAAAALCGLTKNEGLALAGGALAVLLAARRGAGIPASTTAGAAALVALAAGAWPLFRALHGIREQFGADAWAALDLGAAAARLPHIALRFAAFAGCGEPGWHAFGLLCPIALLLGALAARHPAARRAVLAVAGAGAAHVALYGAAFAVTPFDLSWHLGTAGSRLLMHATPWLVLLCALWLRADAPPRPASTRAAS